MADERAMLSGLDAELARARARLGELEEQAELQARQLKETDADRKRLEQELRTGNADQASGDGVLAARGRELDGRRRAMEKEAARLGEREEGLEILGIELAAQERALALAIDQIAEKSGSLRDLEISLDMRSEEIDERERDVESAGAMIEEKLRTLERTEQRIEQIKAGYAERIAALEQRELRVSEAEAQRPDQEQDTQGWVDRLKSELGDRDGDWWAKQLGRSTGEKASKESTSGRLRAIK
ncbi:MAG: hypothetical protein ACYDHO_09090 [Gaiellaceae bacterium]